LNRTAAILLLGILLFNWCGFRFLASYLGERGDRELSAQLDESKYDESQLLSIKVPARHLAYYNPSIQFERVDGQIEVGGIRYNYVKRRLYKDSVEMLCIPNYSAMQLDAAKNEFFKLTNGLQGPDKKHPSRPGSYKSFSPDCYMVHDLFLVHGLIDVPVKKVFYFGMPILSNYGLTAEQPPEMVA